MKTTKQALQVQGLETIGEQAQREANGGHRIKLFGPGHVPLPLPVRVKIWKRLHS